MAKQTTKQATPTIEELKQQIAQQEEIEMKKHAEDFKQFLKSRNLRISVISNIHDGVAKHNLILVKNK